MRRSMAMAQRRELLLAHLFAAPLVRESTVGGEEHESGGVVPITQRNYARERDVITKALAKANRGILFLSEVADGPNFLMNLTGCRVLHFTWNGDKDQEKVMFENTKGVAAPVTEDWLQKTCCDNQGQLPELVVLTAASAKLVAGVFIRAGISNVVAVETNDNDVTTLDSIYAFYLSLAQGFTLRASFDAGVNSLPSGQKERFVLHTGDEEHWISPFDDAERGRFTYRAPRSTRKMTKRPRLSTLPGREIQVQEVYAHMVHHSKVITISGKPGIGKTEVALRACEYARERGLFVETFFVSLQDRQTDTPVTTLKEVKARIAHVFGISEQEVRDHTEGFLGCIQHKCGQKNGDLLLVLDGCSPYFVSTGDEPIRLSAVVEQLCQRVSNLQYIVTIVKQVGIAKEKVVNIGRLSEIDAAELFVASAPREVTVEELRGGMVVSGPQVRSAKCMSLFAGGVIMAALGRHPGAIIAASSKLGQWHLLTHEDHYLQYIVEKRNRYRELEGDFDSRWQNCPQTHNDSVVERGLCRPPRERVPSGVPVPPNPTSPGPGRSNGEFWWNWAVERHTGEVGLFSQTIPWEALCRHSLAAYFLQTLGAEGHDRPLLNDDFQALGNNNDLWGTYRPPGSAKGAIAGQQEFLGEFWPWFEAATLLLKRTGCWGFQRFPVICGFKTTRFDGRQLLKGRPEGTFLLRLSSTPGALAVMYVKRGQELGSVLLKASTTNARKFEMEYTNERRGFQSETIRASLKQLITFVTSWTHLFPDTPKQEALAGVQERQL